MISPIISALLGSIEKHARQTLDDIAFIRGFCSGMEAAADNYPTSPPLNQLGNEFDNQSQTSLLEEVKAMIIELKIKGSVRERANGLIELRTQAFGSIYGRTPDEIEQKLNQKVKEAKKQEKIRKQEKASEPMLSEFFDREYLPYKKNELSENSIKSYIIYMRRFERDNFNKPLSQYSSADIEKYLLTVPQSRTRQVIRGALNNMFTFAKRIGRIKVNPCDNVEKVKHKQKVGRALNFEAQEKLLSDLDRLSDMEKLYILFVYLTGTRRNEALSLTVADVDFDNKIIHIPGTKTNGSNRFMPLTPLVEKLLSKINITTEKTYFPFSGKKADDIMDKLTDEEYHLHELRHTFGTIQICVEKIDAKTVSLWMGHSTVSMTLTRYTHPEQLNTILFLDGSKTEAEKQTILKEQYYTILSKIETILS